MSDSARDQDATDDAGGPPGDETGVDPGPPPTPFDHPLFLPALLFGGMLWFGYDGWITSDPDMLEHRDFNRWGFGVLTLLTAWFGFKGWREWKQDKEQKASRAAGAGSERPDEVR